MPGRLRERWWCRPLTCSFAEAAEAEVRPYHPIETEATSVTLMTGPPPGSAPTTARWTTVATFSLA